MCPKSLPTEPAIDDINTPMETVGAGEATPSRHREQIGHLAVVPVIELAPSHVV